MKIVIVFDFENQDEEDFKIYIKAKDMYFALLDIENYLREKYKYGHDFENADHAIIKIRDEFYNILNDYSVNLY
jgi:hypothetical protein